MQRRFDLLADVSQHTLLRLVWACLHNRMNTRSYWTIWLTATHHCMRLSMMQWMYYTGELVVYCYETKLTIRSSHLLTTQCILYSMIQCHSCMYACQVYEYVSLLDVCFLCALTYVCTCCAGSVLIGTLINTLRVIPASSVRAYIDSVKQCTA
jgi:hypothetical protein